MDNFGVIARGAVFPWEATDSTEPPGAGSAPPADPWVLLTRHRIYDWRGTESSASSGTTVSVPAGSLSLTGYAPTVQTPVTVSIPAGSLSLTGYAPTVSVTAGGVTVSVPAGSLSLTGYAPTVTVTTTIAIPAGGLTLTGYAPFVYTTAGTTVDIPAGGLSLTGYAPTVYSAGSSTESLYYFPLREFAVASSGSVDSTQDLENLRSLLPSQRQQVTNADGTMAAPWYRFFDFFVNVFAGGPSAPTMADVQAAIERALTDLQAQQQTVALVAAQSQTNAEALAATVEVVQNNSLSGSSSIPAVSRTYLEP